MRHPKSLPNDGENAIAKRIGNGVLLLPVRAPWALMQEALAAFEAGFEMLREQPEQGPRDD